MAVLNITATEIDRRIAVWGEEWNEACCRLIEPIIDKVYQMTKKHHPVDRAERLRLKKIKFDHKEIHQEQSRLRRQLKESLKTKEAEDELRANLERDYPV